MVITTAHTAIDWALIRERAPLVLDTRGVRGDGRAGWHTRRLSGSRLAPNEERSLQSLVESDARGPAKPFGGASRGRDAPAGVLEAGTEVLLIALVGDRRVAAARIDDLAGEVRDGRLGRRIADVEDLSLGGLQLHREHGAVDAVVDVREASRLQPIAVHGQGVAVERLTQKGGHDAAVALGIHARSVDVEVTNNHAAQPEGRMREQEMLIERLRGGIRPPLDDR